MYVDFLSIERVWKGVRKNNFLVEKSNTALLPHSNQVPVHFVFPLAIFRSRLTPRVINHVDSMCPQYDVMRMTLYLCISLLKIHLIQSDPMKPIDM